MTSVALVSVLFGGFLIFPFVQDAWTAESSKTKKEDKDFGKLHTLNKLIYWANKEEAIYTVLKPRLKDLEKELELIDKYVEHYESSTRKALAPENVKVPVDTPAERGKIVGSSAILSHLMITRYVTIIDELKILITSEEYMKNEDAVISELNLTRRDEYKDVLVNSGDKSQNSTEIEDDFPNWKDLYASEWAFVHIHQIYGFSPEDISKGMINDTKTSAGLRASHCAKIGMFALNHGYYYTSIEWLEQAIKILKQFPEQDDSAVSLDVVKSLLRNSIKTHNYRWQRFRDSDTVLNTYYNYTNESQPSGERVRGREHFQKQFSGKLGNKSQRHSNFLRLCKNNEAIVGPKNQKLDKDLICYMERRVHPYFILNPVKTEQISKYPFVVQMYNVLGNDTISELQKDLSEGNFQLVGSDSMDLLLYKMRQRTSSSIPFPNPEFVERINKKSEMLTGLRVFQEQDEILQATEYTYGRYYIQHSDAFPPHILDTVDPALRKPGIGNRLATVLYYIEEPDAGGVTPFCELGINIKSKRGSAVFWINLYRNGSLRDDVTHGACPVLAGNKIIVNRWIAYDANFQKFKCSLNQFE